MRQEFVGVALGGAGISMATLVILARSSFLLA